MTRGSLRREGGCAWSIAARLSPVRRIWAIVPALGIANVAPNTYPARRGHHLFGHDNGLAASRQLGRKSCRSQSDPERKGGIVELTLLALNGHCHFVS